MSLFSLLRPTAALIGSALLALGCAQGADPLAPDFSKLPKSRPAEALVTFPTSVAQCSALPRETATATVGQKGGILETSNARFEIPQGALNTPVTITLTQTGDSANSVDFAPAGLQFASVTKLTIGYKNCPKSPTGSYRVIFVNDAMQWLEDMVSWDDNVNGRVTGDLHHFSRYAVAW